jgi:histone H3/H4
MNITELHNLSRSYEKLAGDAIDKANNSVGQYKKYWANKAVIYARWAGNKCIESNAVTIIQSMQQAIQQKSNPVKSL